jgi:hypothetical protein
MNAQFYEPSHFMLNSFQFELVTEIGGPARKHRDFDVPRTSSCYASCETEHQLDIGWSNCGRRNVKVH